VGEVASPQLDREMSSRYIGSMAHGRVARIGFVMALFGVFVAVAPLPLVSGYHQKLDAMANTQRMRLVFRKAEREPTFREVEPGFEDPSAVLAHYPRPDGQSMLVEFAQGTSTNVVDDVIGAGLAEGGPLHRPRATTRLRFVDWRTTRPASAVPYSVFMVSGFVFLFLGLTVLILARPLTKAGSGG
jgi:hypothetical protein